MAQGHISLSISPFLAIYANTFKKQLKVQHFSQKCRFEDQIFSLEIWHIWITFATTWFIFTKRTLFPISKSNTPIWKIKRSIKSKFDQVYKTPPFSHNQTSPP
jgi:hypothetical protein